jgi:chitodextrinase
MPRPTAAHRSKPKDRRSRILVVVPVLLAGVVICAATATAAAIRDRASQSLFEAVQTVQRDDTSRPTRPRRLALMRATPTSVTVSWRRSHDNVGVAGYKVYLFGRPTMRTTGTTHTIESLECSKTYRFGVLAHDLAGNDSRTAWISVSTAACAPPPPPAPDDTQQPSAPANLRVATSTSTSIGLTWTASTDNVGVAGYDVYLNAVNVWTNTGTSFTYLGLSCGNTYTVAVQAYDAVGNRSPKAAVNVATTPCPDTTPPPPPPPPAAPSGVTQTPSDGSTISGQVAWTVSTSLSGVASIHFLIDGVRSWREFHAPYMFNGDPDGRLDTTTLANGAHVLVGRALNSSGTEIGRATSNVTVDNDLPPPPPPPPPSPPSPPPPPPPPGGTVRDARPGQALSVIAASSSGDTVRLVGGVHPKLTLNKNFPTCCVTITDDNSGHIQGVDTGGVGGYVFDSIDSRAPGSSDINVAAFYVHGASQDITIIRSKLSGGHLALKQYVRQPAWARRIKLIDSELWGSWGDLIHIDGADDLLIEHNYLHDPTQTSTHNDAYQVQRANNWRVLRNTIEWDTIPRGGGPNQGIMVSRALSTDTITSGVIANNLIAHWHGGRPLIVTNIIGGLNIVNNTIVDSGDGIGITVTGWNGPVDNVFIWNNILQSVYYERGAVADLLDTNWYTEPSRGNVLGANAHTGSPGFVVQTAIAGTGSTSYDLTPSSPARSLGLMRPGTPSNTIDGSQRGNPPGLGAW